MSRLNWKFIARATGITALAMVLPGLAQAAWPAYNFYTVNGMGHYASEALAINAYAEVGGFGAPSNSISILNGLYGGAGISSQFTALQNNWQSLEYTGINDTKFVIGNTFIGGKQYAMASQFGIQPQSMVNGISNLVYSQAIAVNHAGIVLGRYDLSGGAPADTHMFRWNPSINSRTGDWDHMYPGGINENGTMIAANMSPTNYYQLDELDFIASNGTVTSRLAPGNFLYVYPSGISTYGGVTTIGQAALDELNNSNSHLYGYVYNETAAQWLILDAPGNPFYEATPLAVDVWGTRIVGSTTDANGLETATVWEFDNGQWNASYLSSLVGAGSDWKLSEATGVNTYGAISGWGMHYEAGSWVKRGFVLTPKIQFMVAFPEGAIFGGETVSPWVRSVSANPFDVAYGLTSSSPIVQAHREVEMPGMSTEEQFQLNTSGVDRPTPVDVTINLGAISYAQPIMVQPAELTTMTITPNVLGPGAIGKIGLRGTAGPSGTTVTLTSSNSAVTVPASVKIAAGASTAQFSVVVGRGARVNSVVTITATYGAVSVSKPFTVN